MLLLKTRNKIENLYTIHSRIANFFVILTLLLLYFNVFDNDSKSTAKIALRSQNLECT